MWTVGGLQADVVLCVASARLLGATGLRGRKPTGQSPRQDAEDRRRDQERPRRIMKGIFSWATLGVFRSSRLVKDRLRLLSGKTSKGSWCVADRRRVCGEDGVGCCCLGEAGVVAIISPLRTSTSWAFGKGSLLERALRAAFSFVWLDVSVAGSNLSRMNANGNSTSFPTVTGELLILEADGKTHHESTTSARRRCT